MLYWPRRSMARALSPIVGTCRHHVLLWHGGSSATTGHLSDSGLRRTADSLGSPRVNRTPDHVPPLTKATTCPKIASD
jgi:hypothetical protein